MIFASLNVPHFCILNLYLYFFLVNDCFLTFVVYTPNRSIPYESRCYIMKRTDRQVRLEVEPPLLVSDDVKIEFFTRPRLDYVGLHPKLWKKGNKEFHFWLNTFFVDAEMNGGLAHDILTREHPSLNSCESWSAPTTARVAIAGDSKANLFLNHSSQSSQDRSHREEDDEEDDEMEFDMFHKFQPKMVEAGRRLSQHARCDLPAVTADAMDPSISHLIPLRHHQTVVGMSSISGGVTSLTELMKQNSFLEENQHQQPSPQPAHQSNGTKNGRISHVALTSSISNASSSSSSSSSLTTTASTTTTNNGACNNDVSAKSTTTSFIEKRTRHASVPQTASSPGAMMHLLANHSGERKTGHNSAPTAAQPSSIPTARPVAIDGTNIALRLNKSQIDKAAKDKQCKIYSENFNVTLFLVKPTDQSDDLVDYSLQQTNYSTTSDHFHHITVTPVMSSASTTSCNIAPSDEDLVKCKSHKGPKVLNKKGDKNPKTGLVLVNFPKKAGGEEEPEDDPPPPASPRVVTFCDDLNSFEDNLENNIEEEEDRESIDVAADTDIASNGCLIEKTTEISQVESGQANNKNGQSTWI